MLTQRCLLAHYLIKIEGHYICKRNPVLPSVSTLQSESGHFLTYLVDNSQMYNEIYSVLLAI
jgi:hypothetical protein